MKITKETLHKIAHLARIEVDPEQEATYIKDLEEIVSWVEKLAELNPEDYDPATIKTKKYEDLRNDKVSRDITHDQAMKNAPVKNDRFFEVPNVMKNNQNEK